MVCLDQIRGRRWSAGWVVAGVFVYLLPRESLMVLPTSRKLRMLSKSPVVDGSTGFPNVVIYGPLELPNYFSWRANAEGIRSV